MCADGTGRGYPIAVPAPAGRLCGSHTSGPSDCPGFGTPGGMPLAWMRQEHPTTADTIETYGHALAGFLGFLSQHLGKGPDLAALAALRAADIRAGPASLSGAGLVAASRAQCRHVRTPRALSVTPAPFTQAMPT